MLERDGNEDLCSWTGIGMHQLWTGSVCEAKDTWPGFKGDLVYDLSQPVCLKEKGWHEKKEILHRIGKKDRFH